MTAERAKWILAIIWLAGTIVLFLIMALQSLADVYAADTQKAWGWFLPAVLPTLLLIVGVLVADLMATLKTTAPAAAKTIPAKFLLLPAGLSFFYLVLVALPIILPAMNTSTPALEMMTRSNLWLGPFQGLTAAALSGFFRASG